MSSSRSEKYSPDVVDYVELKEQMNCQFGEHIHKPTPVILPEPDIVLVEG